MYVIWDAARDGKWDETRDVCVSSMSLCLLTLFLYIFGWCDRMIWQTCLLKVQLKCAPAMCRHVYLGPVLPVISTATGAGTQIVLSLSSCLDLLFLLWVHQTLCPCLLRSSWETYYLLLSLRKYNANKQPKGRRRFGSRADRPAIRRSPSSWSLCPWQGQWTPDCCRCCIIRVQQLWTRGLRRRLRAEKSQDWSSVQDQKQQQHFPL